MLSINMLSELHEFLNDNAGTIILFIVTLILVYTLMPTRYKNMPPGPRPLPIIGNILNLGKNSQVAARHLQQKYGDIMTIYIGSMRCVFLCSYDVIKEAFTKQSHVFSIRPMNVLLFSEGVSERLGIASISGPVWKEQRHFTHSVLRDFGVGKSIMEDKIAEELDYFIQELVRRGHAGALVNPHASIQTPVTNVIMNIVFGQRFMYTDPTFQRHLQLMNRNFTLLGSAGLLNVLPFLRHLPGDLWHFKEIVKSIAEIKASFKELIDEHKSHMEEGDEPKDFIDAYLQQIEKENDKDNSSFNEPQLLGIVSDLFAAGSETTTNTLMWGIIFMLHNPDVAEHVHREIDDVIGSARMPSMKDKIDMPYTEATILEILRLGDVVPLGVPHGTLARTRLLGYDIPEDTVVISVLHSVLRDPKVWREPFQFRPEHFLDDDGKVAMKEHLLCFSMGKRVCLGESLARMELFLFFTTMMQRLDISCPPGHDLPSMDGVLGLTYAPKPFDICVNPRHA